MAKHRTECFFVLARVFSPTTLKWSPRSLDGVLQTTNHTNVWSSGCEVVSNEWSNIPCNCKLNWWWKKPNILTWNGNEFVSVQSLFTFGATAWHPFVMYGQTFLGLADPYGKSIVYQAIGSRFVKYQEISTQWGSWYNRICARRSHLPCSGS